jgi:hypothetical protein
MAKQRTQHHFTATVGEVHPSMYGYHHREQIELCNVVCLDNGRRYDDMDIGLGKWATDLQYGDRISFSAGLATRTRRGTSRRGNTYCEQITYCIRPTRVAVEASPEEAGPKAGCGSPLSGVA